MKFDPIECIQSYNAGRDPERLAMKYQRMRSDPFAFLRATCHLFHARLPEARLLREAPAAWICGDLHLENFGSYKGDNRLAYFDLNDFDECALAPASWDLLRFVTSLQVAAPGLGVAPDTARELAGQFLQSYCAALVSGKSRWVERDTAEGAISRLLESLRLRKRAEFLDRRTVLEGKHRHFRHDSGKTLPVSDKQRAKVLDFMQDFARTQSNPKFFQVLDVARRIAGIGSLGLARYAILVAGKGNPNSNYQLDLKEALPSSLVPHLPARQPHWTDEAHRVVAVQQRAQAVPMAFLHAVTMGKHAYVLRALQPSEDRLALEQVRRKPAQLRAVVLTMGQLLAWSHLRGSGHAGSAIADELSAFGHGTRWQPKLLQLADACSVQTLEDWASFNLAYDAGAFRPNTRA